MSPFLLWSYRNRSNNISLILRIPKVKARLASGPCQSFTSWCHVHPIRPCELRALRVKDFLVDQGKVQISRAFSLTEERSRNNKNPYCLPLSATFDRGVLIGKLLEALVFLNAIGRPYTASGLHKIGQSKAKVPYINFYNATRHSIASQSINAGGLPGQDLRGART